jgi:DNA-binding transcriptional LysR family regulator
MKLSELDLNLLLVLSVVLEEQSVTRAARRLHVTAPAVSNSLARLRALLGDALVVRSGRGLALTPRAKELQPRLRAAMAELERVAQQGAAFDPRKAERTFSVACADSDQVSLIPALAKRFSARLPRAELVVTSIDRLEASGGIERAEVDVAIVPAALGAQSPYAQTLYEDEAVLVARRGHPRIKGRLTRELFNALQHVDIRIALGERGIGNRAADAHLARQGLERKVAVAVPTFVAALMIAASSDFVAGVPRRLASTLAKRLPIQLYPIPGAALQFAMSAVWQERTHHDPGSRYFRELLAQAAGH